MLQGGAKIPKPLLNIFGNNEIGLFRDQKFLLFFHLRSCLKFWLKQFFHAWGIGKSFWIYRGFTELFVLMNKPKNLFSMEFSLFLFTRISEPKLCAKQKWKFVFQRRDRIKWLLGDLQSRSKVNVGHLYTWKSSLTNGRNFINTFVTNFIVAGAYETANNFYRLQWTIVVLRRKIISSYFYRFFFLFLSFVGLSLQLVFALLMFSLLLPWLYWIQSRRVLS